MQDRVPTPGKENRVRIRLDDGQSIEGILEYADDASVQGSVYNKANVLPDDVCNVLNIPTSAEPKDAFLSAHKKTWREIERITASKTWIVPDGIYHIGVFLIGGGQSGQGWQMAVDSGYEDECAIGGASGWGKSVVMDVTPGQEIEVIIGAGGVATQHWYRSKGGDTKFGSYVAPGGGNMDRMAAGVQDVRRFEFSSLDSIDGDNRTGELNTKTINAPYGGVSGIISQQSASPGMVADWISSAILGEKNIFDPSMKAFGLGGCVALKHYHNTSSPNIIYTAKPYPLGDMGIAGEAKTYFYSDDGTGKTYKGGNATGYGNGGGACLAVTDDRTNNANIIGGDGSPGIVIIYV